MREKAVVEAIVVMTAAFNPVILAILESLSAALHAGEREQTNGSQDEDFRTHGDVPSSRCGILTSSLLRTVGTLQFRCLMPITIWTCIREAEDGKFHAAFRLRAKPSFDTTESRWCRSPIVVKKIAARPANYLPSKTIGYAAPDD